LGLSIARKIIEEHHGRIYARNVPNGGALFGFTLPLPLAIKT
jgi:signal transduction histidine kinase